MSYTRFSGDVQRKCSETWPSRCSHVHVELEAVSAGMICVKKIMKVNITCDHRIIYGAHAAEFLATLKQVIESPDQLLK